MYRHIFLLVLTVKVFCDKNYSINLPGEHIPYYYYSFPIQAKECLEDEFCPYKEFTTNEEKCWGYEHNCTWDKQYSVPFCPGDHKGWVSSKKAQEITFHTQADFGYIKQQIQEMKIMCEPLFKEDSSLECSKHLRYCRGRNIFLNLTSLANRKDPIRYKMDVLGEGDIGGYCDFYEERLHAEVDHVSPLQSWGPELRYFTKLKHRPIVQGLCDIVIEKPTFILKIDATVNMYHHFCDFLNLYASLHVNVSHPAAFSTDVHILIWETFTYHSAFQDTWEAFTDHPLWDLKTFRGDTVCFRNMVFPLLPRMIFGLYYNTPIIYGCEKSGLFDAFSKHLLYKLQIPLYKRVNQKIKVTFLSRNTKYRRVLNENALLGAITENVEYEVQKVVYDKEIPFKKQLEITRNSDIFIGIHGAGLTHLLFLPEWAAVFELYNCEDPNCYFDLARLKGVKYVTWKDPEKLTAIRDETYDGGAHAKFSNYNFDVNEFVKLTTEAAEYVKSHPKFKEFVKKSYNEEHTNNLQHERSKKNFKNGVVQENDIDDHLTVKTLNDFSVEPSNDKKIEVHDEF